MAFKEIVTKAVIGKGKKTFTTTKSGVYNIFYAFIEYALDFLHPQGKLSYIVPNNFLTIKSAEELRKLITSNYYLERIIDFADNMVFKPVRTYNCIIQLSKSNSQQFEYSVLDKTDDIPQSLRTITFNTMDTDKLSAYQTLYQVLVAVAKLAAPIAPFFMDRLFLDLVEGEESVHYVAMPAYDETVVDKDLEERMALAQRATSMVLALRRKAEVNVRKPLSKIIIPVIDARVKDQLELVKDLILNEVNVKEAEFISDTTGLITKKIKPNFKTLGKIYGKQMKEIAAAFGTLSQEVINEIQAAEASGTGYVLNLPSGDVTLNKGDYEISSEDMPGWLVATEGAMTIALDITITEQLKQEGVARELVNRIQNLRKSSGFDVTDKVDVVIFADGEDGEEINASLANFAEYIGAQTLALSVNAAPLAEAGDAPEVEWNEGTIRIKVTKK